MAVMESAKGFLASRTGQTAEALDEYPEMVYAYYCLCGDMYNKREATVSSDKPNPTVEQIIALHRRNYV